MAGNSQLIEQVSKWKGIVGAFIVAGTTLIAIGKWIGKVDMNQAMLSWQIGEVSKQIALVSQTVDQRTKDLAILTLNMKDAQSGAAQATKAANAITGGWKKEESAINQMRTSVDSLSWRVRMLEEASRKAADNK